MLCAYAASTSSDDPLAALAVGDLPDPPGPGTVPGDPVTVTVRAAALNHHDLWTLKGSVVPAHGLPCVLGTDAAVVDDAGGEYVVHSVLGDPSRGHGDETLDPGRLILSDAGLGALRGRITVPRRNLVPKPPELGWAEAACLPTAWLTAYRMLFTKAGARPGDRVLVHGAGGGVSTAAILLAKGAGLDVQVMTRDAARGERAEALGADRVLLTGATVPGDADIVLDTVGGSTWSTSLAAVRPGGTIVVSGATAGFGVRTNLARLFSRQITVRGSTLGTIDDLRSLLRFVVAAKVRPVIDSVAPLSAARDQFARLASGTAFGKLVIEP
ncbi:zinc-binding dehydrogenase [Dactylosporangium sp. CA-139066]|uniref:zinc-binding dehydrogenase n=1 Tax=Dactylosporangium sp. CA-139066 TaxID=3239930 RepID=UPI003D9115EA